MAKDLIRYDLMVQEALKGVVRKLLADTARDGLPGDHHFYISFRTHEPGVRLSQRMREKYPEEMTIVLQHQFWDLGVTDHAFEVGLSFGGVPERLLVPFDSVSGFFDPSVQFGLKFELKPDEAAAPPVQRTGPVEVPSPASPAAAAPTPVASRRDAADTATAAAPARKPATKPASPKSKDTAAEAKPAKGAKAAEEAGAEIVSLDAFRKKT